MLESQTPTSSKIPPATDDQARELAAELGFAVLATLRKAAAEGRLPENLSALSQALATTHADGAALEPRPDARTPAAAGTSAPVRRAAPGTRTIRMMIRGARDIAQAPPGSELARYRVALLVLMLCLTVLAGALAFGML